MSTGDEDHEELPWVGPGPLRIRRIEKRGRSHWIAEDDYGIAAMAPSKDALQRLIRQRGTRAG